MAQGGEFYSHQVQVDSRVLLRDSLERPKTQASR